MFSLRSRSDLNLLSLRHKLDQDQPLRILFINDLGFRYGAGLGVLQEVQALLGAGHWVGVRCFDQEPQETYITPVDNWLGVLSLAQYHGGDGYAIAAIIYEVQNFKADLVIVGNLHGAQLPIKLLPALQSYGFPVIAYMHDVYFTTGRCCYPQGCHLYLTGCDQRCPTPDQYPALAPELIAEAWLLRRQIFCGYYGIPLVTNSHWTTNFAREALGETAHVETLYLGIDEKVFRPINKSLARQLLNLPQDKFIIVGGSINMNDIRKGGYIFEQILGKLYGEVDFLLFGHNYAEKTLLPGIHAMGYVADYRLMPLVYSAADLFIGTSLEEAFGKTYCEAQACGLPVVAFAVGGIPEVARHNIGARLATTISAEAMIKEINFFRDNPLHTKTFGAAGRQMVEQEFTLTALANRWRKYWRTMTGLD